jgi:hypothetical protein
MLEIPKVSKRILKMLDTAGWTIEKLAEAEPEELTVIDGIGPATAWRIIVGARRLDRKRKKDIPVVPDEQWLVPWLGDPNEPPPRGLYVAPPAKPEPPWLKDMTVEEMEAKYLELKPEAEIPPMSVRVKRNWLRRELTELI